MLKRMLPVVAVVMVMMGGAVEASADCTAVQASYTSTSMNQVEAQMIFGQWANAKSSLDTIFAQAQAGNACWAGNLSYGMGSTVVDVVGGPSTLSALLGLAFSVQNVANFIAGNGSDPSSGALSQTIGLQLTTLYSLLLYVN